MYQSLPRNGKLWKYSEKHPEWYFIVNILYVLLFSAIHFHQKWYKLWKSNKKMQNILILIRTVLTNLKVDIPVKGWWRILILKTLNYLFLGEGAGWIINTNVLGKACKQNKLKNGCFYMYNIKYCIICFIRLILLIYFHVFSLKFSLLCLYILLV